MKSKNKISPKNLWLIGFNFIFIFGSAFAYAGDLEWSGIYRVEGYSFDNPYLDRSDAVNKEYGVHTLILRPKIVAADGLYIRGQFNIFNSDDQNQLGAYFGSGLGGGASTSSNDSNTTSENQKSESIRVTQFYLTHIQEFGALLVGRAPLHFGLGITHNAGDGLFDHYADTRDLVGYKMSMGNFFIMPMYAKVAENRLSGYDDVDEINVHLQYENPESDVAMGFFYQNRSSSQAGNDTPGDALDGNATTTSPDGQYNAKNFNIFYRKATANWSTGFEVAQQSGKSGITADGKGVSLGGFAVATEFEYHPEGSNKRFALKAGFATGDDPSTTDEFEGFIFDRNYDVAMMLFNHKLGRVDLLNNSLIQPKVTGAELNATVDKPDVDAISNAYYISPSYEHKFSDKWSVLATLTGAWLESSNVNDAGTIRSASKDLGYEFDFSVIYKATEKIIWSNQVGYYEPGSAWEVNGRDSDSILGFVTRAAVSF